MTAFTNVSGGWVLKDSDGDETYCVLVPDVTYIRYDANKLKDAHNNDISSVSTPWYLKLTGNFPVSDGHSNRGDDSTNGFELVGAKTDCDGGTTNGTNGSIRLSLAGNEAGYYPTPLVALAPSASERFWDQSSVCRGEPDADGYGDREYCERMHYVSLKMGGIGGSKINQISCPDGDCEIWAGGPPS